jgi:hypothetical protein
MAPDGLKYAYQKMQNFINLAELTQLHGSGITLIVTPVWMFLGVVSQPYHTDPSTDIPLYLDGFAYAGVLTIQEMKQVWPATAGQGF